MSPAGRGVLLDTSVVIDHFRGDPRIHYELESTAALYIPTIVLGELYYGAFRSAYREKQLEQVRRFLRAAAVVGTDAQTSETYGRIRSELAEAGRPIPENDIWIAAVALQHRWPLATRDQHFGRITGLEVLSW
jgi:tRNA(fMet)-specific endonuclease VapC